MRDNLGCFPAGLFVPVNREHVVCENAAELEFTFDVGLDLLNLHMVSLHVLRVKGVFVGGLGSSRRKLPS